MGFRYSLTLNDKVLLAAAECCDGDVNTPFTAEQLVVTAWEMDHRSFGLRGFEVRYPDSNKLYTKIDGRSGLVTKGFLVKIGDRQLRLSETGLAHAASVSETKGTELNFKLSRELEGSIKKFLNHPIFKEWIEDKSKPNRFRGAGQFWGIAPGTPYTAVRERVLQVEQVLDIALKQMEETGEEYIANEHGKLLFERRDLELCIQFQRVLKERFQSELRVLDKNYDYLNNVDIKQK